MIALISAFEYISAQAIESKVQVFSDSLEALSFLTTGYWKASLSQIPSNVSALHTLTLVRLPQSS